MGPGVAVFDYDNDGRLDIFVVNVASLADPTPKNAIPDKSGPDSWNRLYHQKPDGTFEDVTVAAGLQGAGYGMGIAVPKTHAGSSLKRTLSSIREILSDLECRFERAQRETRNSGRVTS